MKKIISCAMLMGAVALSACSTITPEQRQFYKQNEQKLQAQSTSIVANACVWKVELGKDPILFQQSEATAKHLTKTLRDTLASHNISVAKQVAPLVCGESSKKTLEKMRIRYTPKGEREAINSYPVLSSDNNNSKAVNLAFSNLFQSLINTKRSVKKMTAPVPLSLDDAQLKLLRQHLGTQRAVVLLVQASKPSFGAQMAIAVPTALVSAGAYTTTLPRGEYYSIYLVDLQNKRVEWIKPTEQFSGNVYKMPVKIAPVNNMLAPLYQNRDK